MPLVFVPSIVLTSRGTGKRKGKAIERLTKQEPCSQEAIKSYSLRVSTKDELTSREFCSNELKIKTLDLASGPAS